MAKGTSVTYLDDVFNYQYTVDSLDRHLLSIYYKTGHKGYANFQVKKASFKYLTEHSYREHRS